MVDKPSTIAPSGQYRILIISFNYYPYSYYQRKMTPSVGQLKLMSNYMQIEIEPFRQGMESLRALCSIADQNNHINPVFLMVL